jgi:hypothetical protein
VSPLASSVSELELRDVLAKVKKLLASTSWMMGILADLMIVSEVWRENGKIHILAWIPDVDPESKSLRYRRKHIVYDEERREIQVKEETG